MLEVISIAAAGAGSITGVDLGKKKKLEKPESELDDASDGELLLMGLAMRKSEFHVVDDSDSVEARGGGGALSAALREDGLPR